MDIEKKMLEHRDIMSERLSTHLRDKIFTSEPYTEKELDELDAIRKRVSEFFTVKFLKEKLLYHSPHLTDKVKKAFIDNLNNDIPLSRSQLSIIYNKKTFTRFQWYEFGFNCIPHQFKCKYKDEKILHDIDFEKDRTYWLKALETDYIQYENPSFKMFLEYQLL